MIILMLSYMIFFFFFSSRRRHTRLQGDWSSDVCSSDLAYMLYQANVLSSLTHCNIDIRQPGRGLPCADSSFSSFCSALLGLGKERVVGPGVGHAIFESTDSLDPGGYEDIPFTGLDGVESHANGLQRGRAVAVDCDSRDIWHTCQDSHNTCQFETGLTSRFTAEIGRAS